MENKSLDIDDENSIHPGPKYKVLEEIDRGGFGRIYKVRNTENNNVYALKRLCFEGEFQDDKYVYAEVYCLSKLKHPNIISLEEFILKPERLYIIMEYAVFGNIEQYVINYIITSSKILRYFIEVLSAVCYCHSRNIAHRDITPSNILLTTNLVIKLSDWGLATPCGADRNNPILSEDYLGDFRYLPPEVIRCSPFDPLPTDVWSLGCVLYFMLVKAPPFEGTEASILNQQTSTGVILPKPIIDCKDPKTNKIVEIILFMLVVNKNERPNVEAVRNMSSKDI